MTNSVSSPAAAIANDTRSALKFITCGSVDDGKSTLIGRLLVDSKAVLQDHLAGVQRLGVTDLALLTDGLSAEREQGITIDVAYRYFNTEARKFIIGDAPGHEQYTRNMVTAASSADAAVVLVDATKLDWQNTDQLKLLAQTRRHTLLLKLLRVPSIVFAVNKLDAVSDSTRAFARISATLSAFATEAGISVAATVPISALQGWNVVDPALSARWCGYGGPTLLAILEHLPVTPEATALPLAFPVQWVEKPHTPISGTSDVNPERSACPASDTAMHLLPTAGSSQGRRVFWGRVATGSLQPGQSIQILPARQAATVAQVLDHTRQPAVVGAGHSAGVVLDREVDVSRGDWLLASDDHTTLQHGCEIQATVAWLDDQALLPGRTYWALHGHRWVKAKVKRIVHRLDIHTLAEENASQLESNAIGHIELTLQEPLPTRPFAQSRALGSLVLVDTVSHKTAGAILVRE